jgi:hypothetical protein
MFGLVEGTKDFSLMIGVKLGVSNRDVRGALMEEAAKRDLLGKRDALDAVDNGVSTGAVHTSHSGECVRVSEFHGCIFSYHDVIMQSWESRHRVKRDLVGWLPLPLDEEKVPELPDTHQRLALD